MPTSNSDNANLTNELASMNLNNDSIPITKKINLDTTVLIVMVSDLIHRFDEIPGFVYENSHLRQQQTSEIENPSLPILHKLLHVIM
jgi:hypothetical protein